MVARAKALHCGAALAMRQGDAIVTQSLLSESLAIFEEIADRQGVADVLERLGIFSYAQGDFAASRKSLRKSLALFRALENKSCIGWTLSDLGMLARLEGDNEEARSLLEESLGNLRECDDRRGLAYTLNNLGQLMRVEGDLARAQALLEESLAAAREVGDKPFTGWALLCLGEVARRQGNFPQARACLMEGLLIAHDIGYVRHISQGFVAFGVLVMQQGDHMRGVRLISAAVALHGPVRTSLDSAVEHRPADVVSQPLIVQDQFANRIRELFALPTALEPAGALTLASGSRRTRGLDRVGRSTELVCGDMRHHRRLAGSICGMARRSAQIPGRRHRMAAAARA